MNENKYMLDIPEYYVEYKNEFYSYSKPQGRKNLKKILYNASKNYCMYCYNRIKIDTNEYGQLEHALEKSVSAEKLTDCIPNLGIACPVCNDKYKRVNERLRKPDIKAVQKFEHDTQCENKSCTMPCTAYINLKRSYLKNTQAHFLMQPLGVTSEDIGIKEKRSLLLQYDILETKFVPSTKYLYSKEEKDFIKHHIDMFHLNAFDRRNNQFIRFLQDTIQNDGHYTKIEYNNQIVELFVHQILKGNTAEKILKICEHIYTYASLKFRI